MITRVCLRMILTFFCFNFHFSYSQSFQRLFGTSSNDSFSSIVLLPDGDYVITGSTVRAGTSDIYVARIDNSGTIIWENTYGGTGIEDNSVSCINSNGNIVIAASSSSYNGNRDLDIFIFEITTNGLINWSRSYGRGSSASRSDEIPRKLNLSPTGIVLCATIGSPGSISTDVLALEISNNGQIINWQNRLDISVQYGDIPSSIISIPSGGYVMVGGSFTTQNNYDQVIWRLNGNGTLRNSIAFGSANNENAQDVIALSNNDIIVMGNFRNLSGTGLEFSLSSINTNNNFNWIRTYGDNGTKDERAYGFTRTSKGYALCGYTNGKTDNDILLVWTDDQGNVLGNSCIGDNGREESTALVQNSDNSFTIAGLSTSRSAGLDDGFLVRTNVEGTVDNNCSSYDIVQRDIVRNVRLNNYIETNPLLSNNLINLTVNAFTLTNINLNCLTLPLELTSFDVFSRYNSNVLTWTSLNEYNLSHFEIDKSYDGRKWQSIKSLKSEGSIGEKRNYTFIDSQKDSECVYYRLKSIDHDGSYSYSKILRICSKSFGISIYPNPIDKFLNIKGELFEKDTITCVSINNLQGVEVFREIYEDKNVGKEDIIIDLEKLQSGVYVLSISSYNHANSIKIIKN